jgi:hypothetical protein
MFVCANSSTNAMLGLRRNTVSVSIRKYLESLSDTRRIAPIDFNLPR